MSRMTQRAKRISRRVPVPDPPTTSDDQTELEDRQNHHLLTESLSRCQVALTEVRQAIRELISRQECLERYYRRRGPMPESGYFYLPTADQHGLRIDDENDESRLPDREQSVRRHVAEFVTLLRFEVDHALEVAPQVASHADSPSLDMDSRWTHRLIGTLREVRGAILSGVEGRDVFPSALMIPDAGGLETLVALYLKLGAFLEDLGRAASYGSDLPSQASVVQERLLQENEALKEELEDLERKHQIEQMTDSEANHCGVHIKVRRAHQPAHSVPGAS
jgi:hypothetical protein